MQSKFLPLTSPVALALAAVVAFGTTACGGPAAPPQQAAAPATEAAPSQDAAADAAAADLAAREQELAAKEADLALREKEQELARRESEIAAREAAAKKAPAKTTTAVKTASTPKPTTAAPAAVAAAPPPPPVTVPAGTQLSVKLNSPYSTKTTVLGEAVQAQLASDLVVEGRHIAKAGATVRGSVTEVTSGSSKIGAVPALKIDFTQLVMADGTTAAINARINQKGQSEKGRDTAKIAGGTAAGAIIGHQVDDDKGKVIGGVLGGAAGAIAAQKTGTEVEIPAGTVLSANVRTAFTYDGR